MTQPVVEIPGCKVIAKKNEPFEKMMRRWKRVVEKTDIMGELRKREYYEKPAVKRKRAKAAARKRWERRRSELMPSKQFGFPAKKKKRKFRHQND